MYLKIHIFPVDRDDWKKICVNSTSISEINCVCFKLHFCYVLFGVSVYSSAHLGMKLPMNPVHDLSGSTSLSINCHDLP